MDDGIGARQGVLGLAEIGQVGDHAQAGGAAVVADVDVEHVVAVFAELANDPLAALPAASGDDDPHGSTSLEAKYGGPDRVGSAQPAACVEMAAWSSADWSDCAYASLV